MTNIFTAFNIRDNTKPQDYTREIIVVSGAIVIFVLGNIVALKLLSESGKALISHPRMGFAAFIIVSILTLVYMLKLF